MDNLRFTILYYTIPFSWCCVPNLASPITYILLFFRSIMSANGIKIAFGGAGFLSSSVDEVTEWLDIIEEAGIEIIDTAQLYGGSEEVLGKAGASSRFIIDTKLPGGFSAQLSTMEAVVEAGEKSLSRLDTNQVSQVHWQ